MTCTDNSKKMPTECDGSTPKPKDVSVLMEKHFPDYPSAESYANKSQVFKKKIYKGKIAPDGTFFLLLRAYAPLKPRQRKPAHAEIARLIKGGISDEDLSLVIAILRKHLFDKYKV